MTANNATNNQKALKELYISALKTAFPRREVKPRDIGFIIETMTGELIHVEKPDIKKRFCYADDLDYANEYARRVCTEEDFFISQNTADIRRIIEELESDRHFDVIPSDYNHPLLCHIVRSTYYYSDKEIALSYPLCEEDRARALEVYRMVLADFEKRLRSYVKRYGLKNVYSWTYWADA